MPADFQAYQQVGRLKDPQAKIDGYEKFLRDFPAAPMAHSARLAIFDATLGLHKDDRAKVVAAGKQLLKSAPPADQMRLGSGLARALYTKNLYAADALAFAKKAVKGTGSSTQRASAEQTLGQIYLRAGQTGKATQWLNRALSSDPQSSEAAIALGELASTAGRDTEALNYFSQARLAKGSKDSIAKLDAAWRKTHQGSLDGMEAFLDERYHKLFPSPVHAEPYAKSAKRTARTVLAEVYTGSGCPPCLAADLAFDAVLERYRRQDVAVVMYHQHIPRPDPMTNDGSTAIWKERNGRGVPTFLIDGVAKTGGGLREHAAKLEADIRAKIDERLDVAPGAEIKLTATREAETIRVAASIQAPPPGTKLRLVLVEKLLTFSGENGIRFHPMVARSLHTAAAPGATHEHTFDLAKVGFEVKDHIDRFEKKDDRHNPEGDFRFSQRMDAINPANLAVVAYLENEKEVLQAAYVDLRP